MKIIRKIENFKREKFFILRFLKIPRKRWMNKNLLFLKDVS